MESVFQVSKMLFATSVFLVFFVWDLVMAFQRRDPWIQGSALTLTALTVQFLGYFDVQNVDLFGKPREEELQTLLNKQLSLDVARLVFCTLLGCVLPSVAFHSSGGRWANIAALSVSLCLHMGTEVHALQNVHDPILRSGLGEDFIWSSVLLLVAAISLVLYLGLAVVNCKYSRDRLNLKIPTMLSGWVESKIEPDINENEVFKWWVVVRACHQEFWLRSSAFTPAVLMIVTTCVAVVMGKLISRQSILRHSNTSVILTLCLQCAFIVTGWIILIWRWLILLLLCTSHEGPLDSFVSNISVCAKCFSRLVKLITKNLITLDKVSPYKYIPTCVWKALRILVFFIYVMILLLKYLLFLVFVFPLFFNYMCWFLWIGLLLCLVRVRRFIVCVPDFRSKADERLKSPGTEETIYVPVSSVNETRKAKDEAFLDGKGYYENLKSMKCLGDIKTNSGEVIRNVISQNKDKYKYQGVWTMAAVAAISIIAELAYDRDWNKIVKNAGDVYSGAQDLLNFIDFPDNITVNSINLFVSGNGRAYQMSLEADIKMQEIEKLVEKTSYPKTTLTFQEIDEVVRAFATLEEGKSPDLKNRQPKDMLRNFCQYWTVKTNLSNDESADVLKSHSMKCVCKAIFNESCSTKKEWFDRAVSCLGDIIACAALQLHLVVLPRYCRKWAEEFNEENLIRALEIHERVGAIVEGLTSAGTDKLPEDIIARGISHLQQVLTQHYGKSTEEFKQKNLIKALAIKEKFNAIEEMLVSEELAAKNMKNREQLKDIVNSLELAAENMINIEKCHGPDTVPAKGPDENKIGEDSNVDVEIGTSGAK